jgi:hypothetical protein
LTTSVARCSSWAKNHSELSPYYHGTLPGGDIAKLYSSAKVVIGSTGWFRVAVIAARQCVAAVTAGWLTRCGGGGGADIVQRQLGMINNRVFEALACGAVLISDCFNAIEELLGEHVLCYRKPGDVSRYLQ